MYSVHSHFQVGIIGRHFSRSGSGWVIPASRLLFSEDGTRMASVMSTDQGEAGLFPHVVIFRCDDVIVISVAAMPCQFVRDPGRAESAGGGDQGPDGGGGAARLGQKEWEHVSVFR